MNAAVENGKYRFQQVSYAHNQCFGNDRGRGCGSGYLNGVIRACIYLLD